MTGVYVIQTREDARALGRSRFYTGHACKRSHVCERLVSNGLCVECARIAKNKDRAKNGHRETLRKRLYASKNPDRVKEWQKRSSKSRDPFKRRENQKRWRERHPEKVLENRQRFRLQDLEARRERDRRNPEGRRARDRNRAARKRGAEGFHSKTDIDRISADQRGKCAACGRRVTRKERHVDHIQPLSKGGSNWPSNLQILCGPCNLSKSAKDPLTWARGLGKLC